MYIKTSVIVNEEKRKFHFLCDYTTQKNIQKVTYLKNYTKQINGELFESLTKSKNQVSTQI